MANDIDHIKKTMDEVKVTLVSLDKHYMRRDEVEGFIRETNREHDNIHNRIDEVIDSHVAPIQKSIRSQETFQTQVKTWGAAAVVALGIIQFLVGKFL